MASDLFKKFVLDLGDEDTSVAADGVSSAEFTGYIDTGSYTLNAAVSGSLFRGFPNNKAIIFAGDPATGKTFFTLGIIKAFLDSDPEARVFYFDTESAVTNEMLAARGIDPARIAKSEPDTLEKFRHVCMKLLDKYAEMPEEKRFPMLIVLDSLSALPSAKEVADITEGKETKDMTKAPVIKGTFRVLRLKMAKVQVPMIVTNHVYAVIGAYVPTKEMAGGSGAKYAADTIVLLSKSKDKDADKNVTGNIIKCKMAKSRLSREETKVETRIRFDGGLDRYYGLLEIAEAAGLVKKVANKYEFPDGKAFEKQILAHPEKFFTDEFLKKLDEYVRREFQYSAGVAAEVVEDTDDED